MEVLNIHISNGLYKMRLSSIIMDVENFLYFALFTITTLKYLLTMAT